MLGFLMLNIGIILVLFLGVVPICAILDSKHQDELVEQMLRDKKIKG